MKEIIIDIGKYEVFHNQKCMVKFILGSCIGLILYDRDYKITGAIHILLPEFPKYSYQNYPLTAYADTGIEYLINMINNYSENLNLEAIIAGGSNLEGKDYFNIGKKNYLAVKDILKKNKINIKNEYCLKNYPVLFEFNTENFSFKFSNLHERVLSSEVNVNLKKFLDDIEKSYQYLPVLNTKLFDLLKLKNLKEKISFYEIEKIVKEDDGLSFNLLKFANSSYISPVNKITTIKQALLFIGIDKFFNFIANEILKNYVIADLEGYLIEAKFYKLHVISVALLSEYIADNINLENRENIYLGGLFHDIGKIILDRYAFEKFDAPNRLEIINFVEKSINSYAHSTIGANFIEKIGLSNDIVEAVNYHHVPSLSSDENKKFVIIIALANNLISNYLFGTGFNISNLPFSSADEIYRTLNINQDDMFKIFDSIGLFISIAEEIIYE